MFQRGARATSTMISIIVLVWLASSLTSGIAYGDTSSQGPPNAFHQSFEERSRRDIQCTDLSPDSSFCSIRTELRYRNYLNTPLTRHERFSSPPSDIDQPRTDLLAIFRLAMEEFDLLSGVRIYWDYTERNIEQWAIKLRLKGEISISDSHHQDDNASPSASNHSNRFVGQKPISPTSMLSLFAPQKIRWNIGMNPDDLTVFGNVHINPHLSISGEFGDESQVGLYFRYAF